MLIADRYANEFVPLEKAVTSEEGSDPWEGLRWDDPIPIACRFERRTVNVAGGGADPVVSRQINRAYVSFEGDPDKLPEIGDKLGGLLVEAVDDVYSLSGEFVGRVVSTEPGGARGG